MTGWLSAEESDIIGESGEPAAVWRIQYDPKGPMKGDEEELEWHCSSCLVMKHSTWRAGASCDDAFLNENALSESG